MNRVFTFHSPGREGILTAFLNPSPYRRTRQAAGGRIVNADIAVRGGPRAVSPRSPSSLPIRHLLSEVHLAKSLFHRDSGSHPSGTLGPGLKDLGLLTAQAAPPHHLLLHSTAAGGPVPAQSSSPGPLGHPSAVRVRAPEAWRESHQSSVSSAPLTRVSGREQGKEEPDLARPSQR